MGLPSREGSARGPDSPPPGKRSGDEKAFLPAAVLTSKVALWTFFSHASTRAPATMGARWKRRTGPSSRPTSRSTPFRSVLTGAGGTSVTPWNTLPRLIVLPRTRAGLGARVDTRSAVPVEDRTASAWVAMVANDDLRAWGRGTSSGSGSLGARADTARCRKASLTSFMLARIQ